MLVRWGFVPSYLKDATGFPLLFNARGETAAEKPVFRNAIRRRRCLVPATGFYEWRREGQGRHVVRTPYLCARADGSPMALGAIWETNVSADGGEIDTAAILTTAANGAMAAIHDRMPVIVEPADFETWLDCDDERATDALALIRPAGDEVLSLAPVDPALPKPLRRSAAPVARSAEKIEKGDDGQGSLF
jgi:putative SOS response-associated peptidase YedK